MENLLKVCQLTPDILVLQRPKMVITLLNDGLQSRDEHVEFRKAGHLELREIAKFPTEDNQSNLQDRAVNRRRKIQMTGASPSRGYFYQPFSFQNSDSQRPWPSASMDQLQQSLTWARPEILRIPRPPRSFTGPCTLHPCMTSLGQGPRLYSIKPYYAQEARRKGVLHCRREEGHRSMGNSPANTGKGG